MATCKKYMYVCIFFPKYILYQIDIHDVLEEVDRSLFKKISSTPRHPLYPSVPKTKEIKVQRESDFLAVNSLGLIPSVLKIVF